METVLIYLYVFMVCSCIGSFVNVLIYRMPLGLNFIKGRSFCPSCSHQLRACDLVPVLSYIFLRGRCRYCGEKISVSYPLVEMISGLMGCFCFYLFGFHLDFILRFMIFEILIAISMIDLHFMIIPDELNLVLGLCALFSYLIHPEIGLWDRISGMVIVSLPLWIITLLVKNSFGMGDIKLMIVSGFLLGFKRMLVAGWIAIISGGCIAFYLLIRKKKERNSHIPFGPFLSFGIMISSLYGFEIMELYLNLLI